ncbi:hypothetical protein HAX54_007134 [Datura stramonium]|uniref:J domain-containing protein n=1 Tax=Datura stramonium TaxID=4076 RepID=A0ABS8TBC8_DATST|nr:hypothetical protein [Datura stramonium]
MECNKDEAFRAKNIAERKFEQKDYAGAKKFALKAQALYPGLDDLTQMLTTLDVYISAENKISGEVDWYGVLGVSPSADDETVRKQYRKLALILHPDKNKSVGAEGAFKLLSEAWSLLSDKSKRLAYNQRRSSKGFQQKVPVHSGGPSAPPRNGFHNFTSRTNSGPKAQKNASRMSSSSVNSSSNQRSDTFWTICHRCKMHYEYLKMYLNHTLLCPNCHEAFMATETSPPYNHTKSSNSTGQWHQNLGTHAPNGNQFPVGRNASAGRTAGSAAASSNTANYSNFQQDSFSRMTGVGSSDPSIAAKAANVVQQAHEKVKRERDDSQTRQTPLKQRRLDEDGIRYGFNAPQYAERTYGFSSSKFNSTRELTPLENRNMLMEKARKEILKKLNEWKSQPQDAQKHKVKESKKEKQRNANVGHNVNGNVESSAMKGVKKAVNASGNDASQGDPVPESMNVPDPDFHNFDQDRSESCFKDNEVWAAYDADDGMPRFYALISKVLSREPFKVRLSWLNSKTNSEFGPMEWVASGFYKTCGEFRIGRYETGKSVNSFSHKVRWSKGPRGTVQIFPKKGDVWALYRCWSPDWNQNTPDDVIHKYDMVLVLDDYSEEQGVSVAPLIKVAGFKTVFRPDLNSEKVIKITREEMFRFSHQVPSHLLTGEEAQNAPKGCQELDPAATPLELLQTLAEPNVLPAVQNDKVVNGGSSQKVQETKTSETAERTLKSREGGMIESEEAP